MVLLGRPGGLMIDARVSDARPGLNADQMREADEAHRTFVYGFMVFCAGESIIGDRSSELSLAAVAASCGGLLRARGRRESDELMRLDAARCFQVIDDALYLDDPAKSDEQVERDSQEYGRFKALPVETSLDDYKAYVVESGTEARYLWRHDDDREAHELRLRAGELDALLDDFLAWFEAAAAALSSGRSA